MFSWWLHTITWLKGWTSQQRLTAHVWDPRMGIEGFGIHRNHWSSGTCVTLECLRGVFPQLINKSLDKTSRVHHSESLWRQSFKQVQQLSYTRGSFSPKRSLALHQLHRKQFLMDHQRRSAARGASRRSAAQCGAVRWGSDCPTSPNSFLRPPRVHQLQCAPSGSKDGVWVLILSVVETEKDFPSLV